MTTDTTTATGTATGTAATVEGGDTSGSGALAVVPAGDLPEIGDWR